MTVQPQPQNIKNVTTGLQDLLQNLMELGSQASGLSGAAEMRITDIAQSIEKRLAEHPQHIEKKINDAFAKHAQELTEEIKQIRQELSGSISGLDNTTKAAIKAVGELEVKQARLAQTMEDFLATLVKTMAAAKFKV